MASTLALLITYPHRVCFSIANTIYSGFNWNTKKFMWSEQETKILKDLWKKGLTASQIATQIPGKSRNACIGRAHRLNLEARAKSKKTTPKVNTENNTKSEIKTQKLGRKEKFKALLLDKSFPPENPVKLEDLTDDHCRWPLGEKLQPAKFFCGRKPTEEFVYCALHLMIGYQSKNEKEDDIITEEDIPKFIEKKIKSA